MTNRFEYNFTRQSQFQQLKERNRQLQEENNLLKQSLEELIKVNNQLTESIEELNNGNQQNHQNNEEIQERFEMLIDENRGLRELLQNQINSNKNKKSMIDDDNQTESLVNVLQELIESFKNIEIKYQSQINDLQQTLHGYQNEYVNRLTKVEQQLSSKTSTIEALSIQLKRKDEILESISDKLMKIQQQQQQTRPNNIAKAGRAQDADIKNLQSKIQAFNKNLQEKQKVIRLYEGLISNLKGKIMQKY